MGYEIFLIVFSSATLPPAGDLWLVLAIGSARYQTVQVLIIGVLFQHVQQVRQATWFLGLAGTAIDVPPYKCKSIFDRNRARIIKTRVGRTYGSLCSTGTKHDTTGKQHLPYPTPNEVVEGRNDHGTDKERPAGKQLTGLSNRWEPGPSRLITLSSSPSRQRKLHPFSCRTILRTRKIFISRSILFFNLYNWL